MNTTNISRDMKSTASAGRGRRGWCARIALGCGLVAAAVVTVAGVSGAANAATAPTAQLSFSPAKVSVGTQPDMKFASQNVPSGSVLYLQESPDGGRQWTTVAKTTDTQGTAKIAAPSQGVYEFRIIVADDGTELAVSAPATLTVTAPAAPSGPGIPWLKIIVEPVWDAIVTTVIGLIIALF
jgi:hypothetical protein